MYLVSYVLFLISHWKVIFLLTQSQNKYQIKIRNLCHKLSHTEYKQKGSSLFCPVEMSLNTIFIHDVDNSSPTRSHISIIS